MDSVKIEVIGEVVQKEDASDTYEISKDSLDDVLSISDDKATFSGKGIFVGTVTVSDETKTVIFDVDEEVFSYVELNDWVTALENNNADFLSPSYVQFDLEKIKSVTVDDSEVNYQKAGEYLLTYKITDIDGKIYEKSTIVTVGDQEMVKKLSEEGVWVAETQTVVTPIVEEETSSEDKEETSNAVHHHTFDEGKVTKLPTCGSNGEKIYTCIECGEIKSEFIPALGHKFGEWTTVKDATCQTEGIKERTCERCQETESDKIAKVPHTWDEGVVTTPATCTEDGVKTFTCTSCGTETKTEPIKALGHDLHKDVTKKATCGEDGLEVTTCSRCDYYDETVIPATGLHTYNEGIVTKEPICTEYGEKTFTCTVCNHKHVEKELDELKPLGHDYDEGVETTAPTCDKERVA